MANEIRVRANFVAGQLSSAMLTGDTTIQGAGLADLPAIGASEFAPIAIFRTDNAGRVTQKEIVWVTAHTAGATTATATRGREGTTAQAWNVGDRFSHTDTALDNLIVCTEATKPAVTFDGLQIYCRDSFKTYMWMSTQWIQINLVDSGWIAPTLLNGWVNYDTNAYQAARYRKVGDIVYITGLVKSGTIPSVVFNLPVGYRPLRNLHFATARSTGGSAEFGVLEIKGVNNAAPGDVYGNVAGATWFSIECSFMIGP